MNLFKVLVPVHAGAWENWKQFTRALLNHENPYTKRRYAEDPALAWLSMINEGNFGNYMKEIREVPEWSAAWNTWLKQKYGDRAALAEAWGKELKSEENFPAVALPESINAVGLRARGGIAFFSDTEREMVRRMKQLKEAGQYQVWALSPGGRRLARVPVRILGNELEFTADVASGGTEGARMLYELGIK